jgi:6-phosphogluconolactonase (cycloisomerase 2 family)
MVTVTAASGAVNNTAVLTVGPPNIVTLTVSPQTAAVSAGFTQQFTATGTFTDGSSGVVSNAVTWSASDSTITTINSSGLATTLKAGTVTITATSGSVASNGATLTVGPAIPLALNITPANSKVVIGASPSTKLSAIMSYSDQSTTDVSAVATWTNTNSFVASMDPTGNMTPLKLGYTAVSATSGGFTANTGFTVIAVPRYLYFTSDAGQLASKAIIDSNSGQPHMTGYIPTGGNNYAVFPCPTTDPSNQFLYVGSTVNNGQSSSGEVQVYAIDPTSGGLNPLTGSPFPQTASVGCIDFEPTGGFAFSASGVNGSTSLLAYSRDASTGELTPVNSANLSAVPTRVAIDPLGQYLYVGASSDGFNTTIGLGFSIDSSTGALTPVPGSPFSLSNLGGTFTFHPSGNYLYMANTNGYSIDTYSLARATGALTLTSTIPTCINPTPVRFSPDGAFAYTTCSMDIAHDSNTMSVESFAVGPNGQLTHLGSTLSGILASDLTVDPSGQFLYLSTIFPQILVSPMGTDGVAQAVRSVGVQPNSSLNNVVVGGTLPVKFTPKYAFITSSGDNTLLTYGVNSDGTFTATPLSTINLPSTSSSPFSLSAWPWGTDFVLAAGGTSAHLQFFSLAHGLPVSGGSLNNAAVAGGTAIDPSGLVVFETDSANGLIYSYQHASPGGWAWSGQSYDAGSGAGSVAIDPAGSLVYVADPTGGSIMGYQYWGSPQLFNTASQVGGSLYPIATEPLLLAIDPNESFLYAVCGDNTLRAFIINYYARGTITQVASVQLGGTPSGLTIEPTGHFVYTSDSAGVRVFSVNGQTGALTAVPLNPAVTLANITGIYAEPAGQYLYVTTGAQNVPGAVYGYGINSDGTLTALTANPVANPNLPTSMTFSDDIR